MTERLLADFERFDELLARVGAPIAATPHANAVDELDAACASLGLTPPPGLRDWYRWRNGPGPLAPDSPALLLGRFAAVDCDTQPGTIVLFDPQSEMPGTADDRIAADVAELVDRYITMLECDMVTGPEPHWPHRVQIELIPDDPWVYNLL